MTRSSFRAVRTASVLGTLSIAALGVSACRSSNPQTGAGEGPRAETGAAPAVTDPQIAAIVVAANNVDIEAGRLAQANATNPEVRAFGERMVTDHSGVNKSAVDLVTKLGVTPEENPTSRQLTEGGAQTREQLQSMSGAEFDRAYISNEVAYHQTVLQAVDNTLIPSAQNAELKALLVSVRPAFVAHLKLAQQIQASLGGQ